MTNPPTPQNISFSGVDFVYVPAIAFVKLLNEWQVRLEDCEGIGAATELEAAIGDGFGDAEGGDDYSALLDRDPPEVARRLRALLEAAK